ncbi:MAG: hypothetical protein WAW06_01290 [bacterium]
MKKLLMVALVLCLAPAAWAATYNYGWEDCGTVFCTYISGQMICTNAVAPDPIHSGLHSLRCEDAAPSGTPNSAWVWIQGLVEGDIVTGSFWRYDITPTGEPSARIWSHYYDGTTDPCTSNGSASGPSDYGPGLGWDQISWQVTVAAGHTGLVYEIRTYTNPGAVVWIDDASVTVPDRGGITVIWPAPGPSATEETTWGSVKALYR